MPLHVIAVGDDDAQREQTASLSAPQAVREGNRLLLQGDPAAALEAYRHAETLKPDAAEIAFVEGLARFDLKQFDEARMAFQRAAAARDRRLANDALYSLGTCDHAEALEKLDRPQEAVGLLESAMHRYHEVLADNPDHRHTKDANFKAAAVWRQIREMMQQQQQQPDTGENGSDDPQDQERVEPDEQPHDEDSPQERPAQEQLPHQQQDADDEQQQPAPSQPEEGEQTLDQQAADRSDESSDDPNRTAASAAREQVTREQAERRLREMMQNIRERKKVRPESPDPVTVQPVEKDW